MAVGAVGTLGFYLLAAGRSYDYDSSESVGTFIATPSLFDPFRRQLKFNNHPLFSFLEHVVYSAGGTSETALRVAPILAGAAAVALLVGLLGRAWGWLPGVSAGLLLATNPTFAELSRSVRGYSLVTLSAVSSTFLLARLLERRVTRAGPIYSIALAIGIATHLYALLILLGHILFVLARHRLDRRWIGRWAAATALGGLSYIGLAATMFHAARHEQHHLRPAFPVELARAVLGTATPAIVALSILTVIGLALFRGLPLLIVGAGVAGAIGIVWLALAPIDLYPRFLIWLVPFAAGAAAAAVRRLPILAVLVVVAAAAMVRVDIARWTTNPLPSRAAAELVTDEEVMVTDAFLKRTSQRQISAFPRPRHAARLAAPLDSTSRRRVDASPFAAAIAAVRSCARRCRRALGGPP